MAFRLIPFINIPYDEEEEGWKLGSVSPIARYPYFQVGTGRGGRGGGLSVILHIGRRSSRAIGVVGIVPF